MDELTRRQMARTLGVQSSNASKLPPLPKPAQSVTNDSTNHNIDCRKCVHFFVTWEKSCPYGCRAYGFKGPQIPSMVVKSSSGENCSFFRQRS